VKAALGPAAVVALALLRAALPPSGEPAQVELLTIPSGWPEGDPAALLAAPPAPLPLLLSWGPAPDHGRARVEAAALASALGLDLPPRPAPVLLDGLLGGLRSLAAAWSVPGSALPARLPAPRPLAPGRGRALPGSGAQGGEVPLSVLIARAVELGPAGAPGEGPAARAARGAADLRLGAPFPDPAALGPGEAGLMALEAGARDIADDIAPLQILAGSGRTPADRVAAQVALQRRGAAGAPPVDAPGGQPPARR